MGQDATMSKGLQPANLYIAVSSSIKVVLVEGLMLCWLHFAKSKVDSQMAKSSEKSPWKNWGNDSSLFLRAAETFSFFFMNTNIVVLESRGNFKDMMRQRICEL